MSKQRGFTLIEILVVITIIAGLMGMIFILVKPATDTKNAAITSTRMNEVAAALNLLARPNTMGTVPPADMTKLRDLDGRPIGKSIGRPNETSVGIETVFVVLFLKGHNVRVELDEALENIDDDRMNTNPTRSGADDLFEIVDAWHNPFVYFSFMDYKDPKKVNKYMMGDGTIVEVFPQKSEKTGTFHNADTFQLFSAGADGLYGTEDDIKNW